MNIKKADNNSLKRETVKANPVDRVERKKIRVDIDPKAISLTKRPVRPTKWKPKPVYTGELTFKLPMLAKLGKNHPFSLSVIRVHRPRKSDKTHFEKTVAFKNPRLEVKVDDEAFFRIFTMKYLLAADQDTLRQPYHPTPIGLTMPRILEVPPHRRANTPIRRDSKRSLRPMPCLEMVA